MTLCSYNNLQWLVMGYRRPRHYSEIIVTSRNSQVSHSTPATTLTIPLDMYPEAGLWECFWVRDYLLSYRPWLLVEVDGPPRFTIKSSNFHINLPPLLSMPVQRTFHEHRGRSDIPRSVVWYPSHALAVVDCCVVSILVFRISTPRNLASTSTKHCDTHKTTNLWSNPAKLSINKPPHIICRWE